MDLPAYVTGKENNQTMETKIDLVLIGMMQGIVVDHLTIPKNHHPTHVFDVRGGRGGTFFFLPHSITCVL